METMPRLLGNVAVGDVHGKTRRDLCDDVPVYAARPCMVVLAWVAWLFFTLFIYLMPNYVGYMNKHYARNSCVTPTWDLMKYHNTSCLDGSDLTELARAAGRFNWRGEPTACGCTEGIFGEDICVLGNLAGNKISGQTVSRYIGTTTGISAFSIASMAPIAVAWIYGTGDGEMLRCLGCAEPTTVDLHTILPPIFALLAMLHYILISIGALRRRQWGPLVITVTAILAFVGCFFMFNLWGRRYKQCSIEPGSNQKIISTYCKMVLSNQFRTFYYEAGLLVSLMSIAPALCTWAAWAQRRKVLSARGLLNQNVRTFGLYSYLEDREIPLE